MGDELVDEAVGVGGRHSRPTVDEQQPLGAVPGADPTGARARVAPPDEGGVHTRWLFHGAGDADVVEAIVDNPTNGFQPLATERALWGQVCEPPGT